LDVLGADRVPKVSSVTATRRWQKPESDALVAYLDETVDGQELRSSAVLEIELRRLAVHRHLDQSAVSDLHAGRRGRPPAVGVHEAGAPARAAPADLGCTLHLATALRAHTETMVAYDARLVAAARSPGVTVQSPSRGDDRGERLRTDDGARQRARRVSTVLAARAN
jgi:hypothetical protein